MSDSGNARYRTRFARVIHPTASQQDDELRPDPIVLKTKNKEVTVTNKEDLVSVFEKIEKDDKYEIACQCRDKILERIRDRDQKLAMLDEYIAIFEESQGTEETEERLHQFHAKPAHCFKLNTEKNRMNAIFDPSLKFNMNKHD